MKTPICVMLCAGFLAFTSATKAQAPTTYKRKGYTLTFTNNDPTLDGALQKRLIETFFEVYPKLAKAYNQNTLKKVDFVIDTAYKGVAATNNGRVVYNPGWFHKHPGDIDVVTHEVMHIVQNYGKSVGPGWLTEGIADYVRYKFGVDNPGANWKLPDLKESQNYTNSYRITARFLLWMEEHQKRDSVKELDEQLRDHTYTADSWKQNTGKSLDELWAAYVAEPKV